MRIEGNEVLNSVECILPFFERKTATQVVQILTGELDGFPDPTGRRVLIRPEEPLDVEIRHFVDSVQNATPPLVSGRDALNAMRFVWEIQRLLTGRDAAAPCPT